MTENRRNRTSAIDMTQGSPIRLIVSFALPLLIGHLLQQVYSLTDTMIAGHVLGANALAAIGATASLYNLMLGFILGLTNGCGIVLGKLFGARDMPRIRKAAAVMLIFNVVVGLVLSVGSVLLSGTLLTWLNTPEAIYQDASAYMLVLFGCMLSSVIYNTCAGFMRALGNSRIPLYFLMLSCGLNILLDLLLMAVFRMGVTGAALATVIAQTVSAVCSFLYIRRNFRDYLPEKKDFVPDRKLLGEMAETGLSMAMMSSVVNVGSVMMTSSVNSLGETFIAADATARKLFGVMTSIMINLGAAGAAFASQNMGAGQFVRVRRGIRLVVTLCAAWCLLAAVLVFTVGELAVRAIIGDVDDDIVRYCLMNLRTGALMYVPLGFLLCIRQAMQTLGMHIMPVLSSSIELGMKVICALVIVPAFAYDGAVWGEPSTWVACGLFLGVVYLIRRRKVYPDLRRQTT